MRRLLALAPALLLAASYPLYIQLDALPRANAVGPPVADRYPWFLAAIGAAWVGARAASWRHCVYAGALLSLATFVAYTDDAAITGVAMRPARLALAVCALIFAGYVVAAAARRLRVAAHG